MSDTKGKTPENSTGTREQQLEQVEHDAEAMERPDRAIPLDDAEEDVGVGQVTHLVP